jgi:hypothetical protein
MIARILALIAGAWLVLAQPAFAASYAIDSANNQNGIYDLYSATFDGAQSPCGGGSPSYCTFLQGDPPTSRAISFSPTPTGVATGVPAGISPAPASGSFLDLTLGGGNTTVTVNGGTIFFPPVTLVINSGGTTTVTTAGMGMVFTGLGTGLTAAVDGSGVAELLVEAAPAFAVDFSTLIVVTSCTGPLCALVPILSLDMVRYRLLLDFDPTFSTFTGDFIGQGSGGTMIFANLDSVGSQAVVPIPAAAWLGASALGLLGLLRRRFVQH